MLKRIPKALFFHKQQKNPPNGFSVRRNVLFMRMVFAFFRNLRSIPKKIRNQVLVS